MLEIFILLAKYFFIAYIFIFLLCGFLVNLAKEGVELDGGLFSGIQRAMIILFHISGFIILIGNDTETKSATLTFGCITLLFLIFSGILLKRIYKNSSTVLYNGIFFLADIGIVMLARLDSELAVKQFIWCLIGFAALVLLPFILNLLPRLDSFKIVYAAFAVVLLVSTLVFGTSLYGSTNWISIGPIAFQPSEVVKLLFVFFLASAMAQNPTLRELIAPAIVSAVIILCLVGQKDLGSALIFAMTFLVVVYIATSNGFLLALGLAFAALASYLGYLVFPHVQTRVNVWLDPWSDIEQGGYQIAQSLFAIGSYGLWGSGFTRGYATYIPVVERDFIFSAICEEFGVLFGIGLILVFVMIFLEGVRASLYSRSRYLTLLSAGLTSLLAFQTFLIIGGDIKFVPLTGVTLPFVSYGGTSIAISFVIISIIQWIYMRNNIYKQDKAPEEYTAVPESGRRRATETEAGRRRRRRSGR
jgi:cell division protein FtsW (lipid II flippase)